ncbi:hypothetical protein LPTSP2_38230 [Leptospira ellinghausenii]|uniref:PLD phosphodiesterase domain-containing protein n=1 Tax=Leptospira ellinghausenii TaxID=1917822 RepID=A0A2P2DIX4_9LEPT|nr:VPA1262 family N-terminal domain-containing protein [Leptospira ellinghausenii]GBF44520.1 hypothetical protein LPTSP2_38230 [Leptospira ellinghausenii]
MIEKLKQKYSKAVRTTLLAQDKLTSKWYHFFSVIELQTEDEYPYSIPNEKWENGCVRAKQSNLEEYTFYLSIDEIASVDEALKSFNNPTDKYEIDGHKISFFNSSFVKEPSGNYPLVFGSNFFTDKGVSSILPKRKSGLLVWCQIDGERKTDAKFISTKSVTKEMSALQSLTLEWLDFDILQKREHIGNVYLSAPNPYFREIKVSLSIDPLGVNYKVLTRGITFEPLIFRIIDKHGDAIAFDKSIEIKNQAGFIELPHEPHLFELRIYNKDKDLIAIHEPSTFVRSFRLDMSMKHEDINIKVNSKKGIKEFSIEKYSKESPYVFGKPKDFIPEYFFRKADEERHHSDLAKRKEFIFYSGAKEETEIIKLKERAKSDIREIVNNANDTCYLCDPYFSSMDIVEFAFHIRNISVKINILNSKEFITKEEAKNITNIINEYNSKGIGKIDVRILRGDGILHDRFVVTDNNIWFIGSSFNEIGKRATCVAKIPESSGKLIIKEIEKWFSLEKFSQNISDFANEVKNG